MLFLTQAAAPATAEAVEEMELPLAQKLVWGVVILVAVGVIALLIRQVFPPGFALF